MNICKDCKFFVKATFDEVKYHECAHEECRHVVTGVNLKCIDLRKKIGACGVDGKFFEGSGFIQPVLSDKKCSVCRFINPVSFTGLETCSLWGYKCSVARSRTDLCGALGVKWEKRK